MILSGIQTVAIARSVFCNAAIQLFLMSSVLCPGDLCLVPRVLVSCDVRRPLYDVRLLPFHRNGKAGVEDFLVDRLPLNKHIGKRTAMLIRAEGLQNNPAIVAGQNFF